MNIEIRKVFFVQEKFNFHSRKMYACRFAEKIVIKFNIKLDMKVLMMIGVFRGKEKLEN